MQRSSSSILGSMVVLAVAVASASCAIVGRPTGGERDTTGPVLDTLLSTPNFATNARPQSLTLVFDEYVVLKNASRDVVLTPTPEAGRPRYEQRGREVRVDLSEVELRDSTTYQVLFGEAIQDLNEGNPAESLKYVFSTGDYLDSLEVRGSVRGSLDELPVPGVLVGLYRNFADTALTRAAPDYFSRSDSTGAFLLDYLAPGAYQLVAYQDENANYRLNVGAEPVAFLDTAVTVAAGLADTTYALTLSAERPPLVVLRGEQLFPGLLRLTLNQPAPPEAEVTGLPGDVLAKYQEGDSLFVAYAPAVDSLEEAVVLLEGEVDTVALRQNLADRPGRLRVRAAARVVAGSPEVEFVFSQPIRALDQTRLRITVDDTTEVARGQWTLVAQAEGDEAGDPRVVRWQAPTDTVTSFGVSWLPGALTTVFDSTNRDTLTVAVRPVRADAFGSVDLALAGLDSTRDYVLELLDKNGTVERTVRLRANDAPGDRTVSLARVAGGNYSVRITDDDNRDGRYSPGDRRLRRQPERVRTFPLQQVRADWQTEERIDLLAPTIGSDGVLNELLD